MSKVREKGSTSKSGFFLDEMLKIIRQIHDFGRFFDNFCSLGVFLAKNKKILKDYCFQKVKIEKNIVFY